MKEHYRGYIIIQKPSGYYFTGTYSGVTETLEDAKQLIDFFERAK
jgi:hypothetical protein